MARRKNLDSPDVSEMERIAVLERRRYQNEYRKNHPEEVKEYNLRAYYKRAMLRKEAEDQASEAKKTEE